MPPRPRAATAGIEQASESTDRRSATPPAKAAAPAKAPAKKAPAPSAPSAKKAPAKKAAAVVAPAHAPAKKAAADPAPSAKKAPAKKAAADPAPVKAAVAPKKAAPKPVRAAGGYAGDERFLAHQRELLLAERATYLEQANLLQAEAESLVEEMEPGDVQFDEESGEGGTVTVDRERDLALSAQALAAVEEIDDALHKIETGRYGVCEGCGELITKPRLEALPFARLCIACKSGGLSRR